MGSFKVGFFKCAHPVCHLAKNVNPFADFFNYPCALLDIEELAGRLSTSRDLLFLRQRTLTSHAAHSSTSTSSALGIYISGKNYTIWLGTPESRLLM